VVNRPFAGHFILQKSTIESTLKSDIFAEIEAEEVLTRS